MFTILAIFSFILGSIPAGYLIGKFMGRDVTKEGSGNIGATNVLRTVGKKAGLITFIFDFLKGALPIFLATQIFSINGEEGHSPQAFLGLIAIIGHCYSPFMKFKGGKGVATALGVFTSITPYIAVILVIIFAAVLKLSRYVSLSSITAALAFPILLFLKIPQVYTTQTITAVSLTSLLVIYRHKENIKRLLKGEEAKI